MSSPKETSDDAFPVVAGRIFRRGAEEESSDAAASVAQGTEAGASEDCAPLTMMDCRVIAEIKDLRLRERKALSVFLAHFEERKALDRWEVAKIEEHIGKVRREFISQSVKCEDPIDLGRLKRLTGMNMMLMGKDFSFYKKSKKRILDACGKAGDYYDVVRAKRLALERAHPRLAARVRNMRPTHPELPKLEADPPGGS